MAADQPLSRHFAELVGELAQRTPSALAVVDGDKSLSYAELDQEIDRFALALQDLGISSGGTVGLLSTNSWEWICTSFGAQRLGARVAAFNTFAKAWDLDYMLAHSEAEVLVCVDRLRSRDYLETLSELLPELAEPGWHSERFERLREVVLIAESVALGGVKTLGEVLPDSADNFQRPVVSPTDDAFVLYTSGSSARPKAVPMQHYAAIENGFAIGERAGLRDDDRVLVPVPLFWAYGAVNALPATLTHGAALVLQPVFDAEQALDLIEHHRCTAIYTLPNITDALLGAANFSADRVASLRTGLMIGTEAELRRTHAELAVEGICNIYGGTETYGNCCVTPTEWPVERRVTSQGPPLPGVQLRIVDQDSGELLGAGQVGEIHVTGYLARGYLGDSSGAGAAFGDDGWYRTGDLGSLDEEGALHFSSRATEMIKTGGINVAPREVEEILMMHPAVKTAAVVGVPDERVSEVVVGFVSVQPGKTATDEELRSFCSERVAAYKVPARVHQLDALPATDTGKLARRRLVELDQAAAGSAA